MPNGWRTINSLVHKIRLHGRRGKGMAESFSRQKSRHAPQKEGGLKILCDLPPVWPRLVRPTNLMSRMDGKKTHTHTPDTRNCSLYSEDIVLTSIWVSDVLGSVEPGKGFVAIWIPVGLGAVCHRDATPWPWYLFVTTSGDWHLIGLRLTCCVVTTGSSTIRWMWCCTVSTYS